MKTEIKVLIAEHDSTDVELVQHELKQSKSRYLFKVVQNESDYVEALRQFNPHIILSDFTFPSFDGPTAFKIRQAEAPETPFIFVSGTIGEERSIELIRNGVTDYCLKEKLFTLNHKIERALKESQARLDKIKIEEELKQSEMRLARAQHVAHMGDMEFNFETGMMRWSPETFRIHGLKPANGLQSLDYTVSFIHFDDREGVLKFLEAAKEASKDFSITYRIVSPDNITKHVFLDAKLEFGPNLEAIGLYGTIRDVTELVLIEKKLELERSTKQKEITDAVLTAQEFERAEIGKELHDNLNQVLGATKLYIELAKTNPQLREMCLEKASKYIYDVIDQIRKISKTMIIPNVDSMGLEDCIKILIADLTILHPITIKFHITGIDEKNLGSKLQLNLFRIVQEQVNNIIKHSKATKASIHLTNDSGQITLLISDNGKGHKASKSTTGVGVRNIMSRVDFFHGTTQITSATGKGYQLKVTVPMESLAMA